MYEAKGDEDGDEGLAVVWHSHWDKYIEGMRKGELSPMLCFDKRLTLATLRQLGAQSTLRTRRKRLEHNKLSFCA